MKFGKAYKLARFLYVICCILCITFLLLRTTYPTLGWVLFGTIMLVCVFLTAFSWKYLRCIHCGHVIPVFFRATKNSCPTCMKPLPPAEVNVDTVLRKK